MPRAKNRLFNAAFSWLEKRRLRRSFKAPFITGTGRDSYCYYENGRSVEIHAEMILGRVTRRTYNQKLKWTDNDEILDTAKQAEVLSKFCAYLDRHKIKWKFHGSENPASSQ